MVKRPYSTMHIEIQVMMVVKLQQLQREELPTLVYENIEDYLNEALWKKRVPLSLHEAANDVMTITASDIVKFLSRQAFIKGGQKTLAEFSDLIGGE